MWAWCSRVAEKDWAGGCTDAPARVDCRLKRLLEKAVELRLETSIMFVYDRRRAARYYSPCAVGGVEEGLQTRGGCRASDKTMDRRLRPRVPGRQESLCL